MSKGKKLKTDTFEKIIKLSQANVPSTIISECTGASIASVSRVISVFNSLANNDYEAALKTCQGSATAPMLLWGLEKLNMPIPNQDEQLSIEAEPDSSELATESDTATDSKPSADIMYALSKIDERLETICFYLESLHKEQNANSDNIYKVIANMNNSVLMEMRKRKNRI